MPLYICSLPNPGESGVLHECIADDPGVIEAFARREDKKGRGVYDCVSPLKPGARRRSLETVGEIVALHLDIDPKDITEDLATVDARLSSLLLPPTEIRNSGRGRHVRYALKEPIDASDNEGVAQAGDLLKRLTAYLCGDMAVAHHAALLRRPGTHNSKDGAWIECTYIARNPAKYDPDDIADFLADVGHRPLFTRKSTGNGRDKTASQVGRDKPPTDVEARLAAMAFEGAGEASIHQTQLSVTASLLRGGVALEETTRIVLEATRAAAAKDARAAKWNWRREERKIRRMGADFIAKYPEELGALLPDDRQKAESKKADATTPQPPPCKLAEAHAVFKKWLGSEYDLDAASAAIAAVASERLPGDPLWLLIVAGPGSAKTETVQALAGAGAHVTSTIASEGALLSATPRRERYKKATGGLLRKIGDRGVLVIKDVTSILSADRNTRASVLAAIREVYDGRWERNVGTDGGATLTWTGRIVIVGAVTTAWDAAHAVVATMGDRFVLLRPKTNTGRRRAGLGAIRNTGDEIAMRGELAAVVGGVVGHMDTAEHRLTDAEVDQLLKIADIVTMARSAVERDYRGDIVFAHDPEMPTRFAKQLVQLLRGAVAIGMTPDDAMRLVLRCARDSIPPLRRDILLDLAGNPGSRTIDVRKRISRPRNTVRRELECMHMLGLLCCDETEETGKDGKEHTIWHYRLADDYDEETLRMMADKPAQKGLF
jgi:hypothetical protein